MNFLELYPCKFISTTYIVKHHMKLSTGAMKLLSDKTSCNLDYTFDVGPH